MRCRPSYSHLFVGLGSYPGRNATSTPSPLYFDRTQPQKLKHSCNNINNNNNSARSHNSTSVYMDGSRENRSENRPLPVLPWHRWGLGRLDPLCCPVRPSDQVGRRRPCRPLHPWIRAKHSSCLGSASPALIPKVLHEERYSDGGSTRLGRHRKERNRGKSFF